VSEYRDGYRDGFKDALRQSGVDEWELESRRREEQKYNPKPKPKRKLSSWQKYVKVNSKKPRFKYKSGSKKGRVNFKALGVAFRKTPAGKKKRR